MRALLTAFALLVLSTCAQAQVGSLNWSFQSRADVVPTLQKTRGNLRATYEVLLCSARYGYELTALSYYEDVVSGKEFSASADDSAAYAFAYAISDGLRPWNWRKDSLNISLKSNQAMGITFRDRASKLKPKSAEVLVMQAFWEMMEWSGKHREEAYRHTLEAAKIAPQWADAYYWLGWAAEHYALTFTGDDAKSQETKSDLGRLMLRAYDKAESLDKGLRPHLYMQKLSAYELIGDKESSRRIPEIVDAHLKAFPYYGAWYQKRTGKNAQEFRQMWARRANALQK